jgi:hypothetical protein
MQIDLNFPQRRERFRGAQEVRCVLARKYTAQVPRVDVPLVQSSSRPSFISLVDVARQTTYFSRYLRYYINSVRRYKSIPCFSLDIS